MSQEHLHLEKKDGVAILTMNRPETLNSWNFEMVDEACNLMDELDRDDDIRAVILTGAGRGFSSGTDVSQLSNEGGEVHTADSNLGRTLRGRPTLIMLALKIRNLRKPVIAAVNGVAAGGGFALALACDMRIASEKARFSMSFVKRGLVPDCGGSYFLSRLVGPGWACELIFTGAIVDAREAERMGVVNRVVPQEELIPAAKKLAKDIAGSPPLAVMMAKQTIYKAMVEPDLASHAAFEAYSNGLLVHTEDFKEGVAAFLQKREPVFRGK